MCRAGACAHSSSKRTAWPRWREGVVRGEHGSAPAYAGASKPQLTVMKVVPAPALFFFAPPCQAVLA